MEDKKIITMSTPMISHTFSLFDLGKGNSETHYTIIKTPSVGNTESSIIHLGRWNKR